MANHLAKTIDRSCEPLAELASRLPAVSDYYQGVRSDRIGPLGLNNVLMFRRTSLSSAKPIPPDFHHRHVLLIPLRGAGDVQVGQQVVGLAPGRALRLSPFVLHSYPPQGGGGVCWLFITFDQRSSLSGPSQSTLYQLDADSADLLRLMLNWYLPDGPEGEQAASAAHAIVLAAELLLERLRRVAWPIPERAGQSAKGVPPWLPPILERMEDLASPLPGIEELAACCGLSASHLRAQFRARFGVSLGAYIRSLRVRHAMELVASRHLSIGDAAERCGFSSVYAFSRTAKSVLGCAPSQYLQQAKTGLP